MTDRREADLYAPLKAFLEKQGYTVRGEVAHCDLVAVRDPEPPIVIEMKRSLNLDVVLQAVDRTRVADTVYVAVPETRGSKRTIGRRERRRVDRMFRLLGIGLITVGFRTPSGRERATPRIEVLVEPGPYRPRRNLKRQRRLRREFDALAADFNTGGTTGLPRMTAYRQDALLCGHHLSEHGSCAPREVKAATGIERAGTILYRNVYGWFDRPETGVYTLSEAGILAMERYAPVVRVLLDSKTD